MNDIQYIIVGGFPRSGKSTFVSYCQEIIGENYTLDISTVDLVKNLAIIAGWDGTKTPKNRKFLSDLKQLLIEWDDVPYKDIIKTAQKRRAELDAYGITHTLYVFVQCREPEEIQKFVDRVGARTLFISRKDHEKPTNESDIATRRYNYDTTIFNDGDLDQLALCARAYIKSLN